METPILSAVGDGDGFGGAGCPVEDGGFAGNFVVAVADVDVEVAVPQEIDAVGCDLVGGPL